MKGNMYETTSIFSTVNAINSTAANTIVATTDSYADYENYEEGLTP